MFAPVDVLTTPPLPFDKELDEVLLQLNDSLSRQSDNEVVADNATEVVVSPSDTGTQLNTHDNIYSQEDVGTDDTQLNTHDSYASLGFNSYSQEDVGTDDAQLKTHDPHASLGFNTIAVVLVKQTNFF